jgi:hypothetical protein
MGVNRTRFPTDSEEVRRVGDVRKTSEASGRRREGTREAQEAQNKALAQSPKVSALVLLTRQGIEAEGEVETSGRELAVNSGQEGSPGHGSEQASEETK